MGNNPTRGIGFVSTRLAGMDGVSLEAAKWSRVLSTLKHECFCFAGESDWPEDRSYLVPEAHFIHPDVQSINRDIFDDYVRSTRISDAVHAIKTQLKAHLKKFVKRFGIDLLIAENVLSLPMNVPLGLALAEFIAETSIPTIAHHHDFTWERSRYAVTAGDDYLRAAFPPTLRSVVHVVINSFAARQLALRTGLSSMLIPNVMDFDSPPPQPDEYVSDLRSTFGIPAGEHLLLQPTRIVPRKRIELSVELARRLKMPCALLISHSSGDEGKEYEQHIRDFAELLDVKVVFGVGKVNHRRETRPDGTKVYSLADLYPQADLVTYPSVAEGFGNAFLETIYYRRPIFMSTYEIFKTDIQPKGFKVIGFEEFLTEKSIREASHVLKNPELAEEIVEHNYRLGREYYSYRILEKNLEVLMAQPLKT